MDFLFCFYTLGVVTACSQRARSREPDPAINFLPIVSSSPKTNCDEGNVTFYLYSSRNEEGMPIDVEAIKLSAIKDLMRNKDFKFIIHGWRSTANEDWVIGMKNAYLKRGDSNVILVDWATQASCTNYLQSASKTRPVGEAVAGLLEELIGAGVDPARIHLVGHSLGAHVAGTAGHTVSGQIGRITGLDAARPGYEWLLPTAGALNEKDAQFVDAIHTSAGTAGYVKPLGHADFYPNGGVAPQPGCSRNDFTKADDFLTSWGETALKSVVCSHSRAHALFIESINNGSAFKAYPCTWDYTLAFKTCDHKDKEVMGEDCPPRTRGIFYLETKMESPYGEG